MKAGPAGRKSWLGDEVVVFIAGKIVGASDNAFLVRHERKGEVVEEWVTADKVSIADGEARS